MIYDREGLERNRDYVAYFQEICTPYQIQVVAVLAEEIARYMARDKAPFCVLVRTICPKVNQYFEKRGIPVYNSYEVSRICNDKGKTLEYFKKRVLSVPSLSFSNQELESVLASDFEKIKREFQDNFSVTSFAEQEIKVMEEATDFVVKAVDGHGGRQVFSLCKERERVKTGIATSDFVLQPMICGGERSTDMRVYVVGNRIVAAIERSSECDFRANYSLGGKVRLRELNQEQEDLVNCILDELDFGMAGIDFIFDACGNAYLNEIEDVVGARMLYRCAPDIDIAKQFIQYIVHECC